MIFNFATVLAMAAPPGSEGGGIGQMVPTFTMFAAIIGIFYFMIIRPQQKRMKEHQNLLSAIKRGDKVLLTGGMHGTIYEVEEKTLMVEIAKNTVVRVEKGSVQSVVTAA